MNQNFYYEGRQIKNYLIGFASIFSEIPYKNRNGKLESVPIHYGSPSDIISYLEMNVDNDETHNRNRLKDISVPLFSFRMTSMEQNLERRRAPLDTITVDLRPLGYGTGYVAMKPAPFKFTFELLLWASSDYQAFEIVEQIVPYFNTPQQVTIEPLPRCPVSTTEVFLESLDIDTEPDSQKYSALVTMNFNLSGWLLSQPRIWSTNMQFELSMLDKDNITQGVDLNATDYSVGHEIIDNNSRNINKETQNETTIISFIKNSNLKEMYSETLDIINILKDEGYISYDGHILTDEDISIIYKGQEKVLSIEYINWLIDENEDLEYLYKNFNMQEKLLAQDLKADNLILDTIIHDDSETIEIYLKLLDNNLVTFGFNLTDIQISNAEKLNIFGTPRIDIDDVLNRMKMYYSVLTNFKVKKESILFNIDSKIKPTFIKFELPKDFEIDERLKIYNTNFIIDKIETVINEDLSVDMYLKLDSNQKLYYLENDNLIEMEYDEKFNFKPVLGTMNIYAITIDTQCYIFGGLLYDPTDTLFDSNKYFINGQKIPLELSNDIQKVVDIEKVLNSSFKNIDKFIIATLLFNKIKDNLLDINDLDDYDLFKIANKKYNITKYDVVEYANILYSLNTKLTNNIDLISIPSNLPISTDEFNNKQIDISPDLSMVLALDKNNKPIYDVNNDGYINKTDLEILGSEVDDIESYDYELKYGIWYKRFNINDVSEERILKISQNLKTIYYLTEKNDMIELKLYLELKDQGLVSDQYSIISTEKNLKKIKALGYNSEELEDKLLFMRMFVEAVKNIMIDDRDFILYQVPEMNEDSKSLLYRTEGLDIDSIVLGKFIEKYFQLLDDYDQRIKDDILFRQLLSKDMGEFYNAAYEFNLMWVDIVKTDFFKNSLQVKTPRLDEILPYVKEKIDEILK